MLSIAAKVDIGVGRSQNDDRALINDLIIEEGTYNIILKNNKCLAAICDGVGGEMYGYEAAQITLEVFSKLWGQEINEEIIKSNIYISNKNVLEKQKSNLSYRKMSTTLAGLYINESDYIIFNVGDSRVYRFRNKYISLLSRDHSLVQELVDLNILSREEAANDPRKNQINRFIGHPTDFTGNIYYYSDSYFEQDILMICTDGLYDVLTEDDFEEILGRCNRGEISLEECCNCLIETAIKFGSRDNISVILIRKG